MLLTRLMEISKGKWSSVGTKGRNPPNTKKKGPKSMNYLNKKKELQRIDRENMKMMNRIIQQGAILNTRKLEAEYREKQKIMRNLQRNTFQPLLKKVVRQKV